MADTLAEIAGAIVGTILKFYLIGFATVAGAVSGYVGTTALF